LSWEWVGRPTKTDMQSEHIGDVQRDFRSGLADPLRIRSSSELYKEFIDMLK